MIFDSTEFTAPAFSTIERSLIEAQNQGNRQVEPEHLLLALLHAGTSKSAISLGWLGITYANVVEELKTYDNIWTPLTLPLQDNIRFSIAIGIIVERARKEADALGDLFISEDHLFLGLLSIPESRAYTILNRLKNSPVDLANKVRPLIVSSQEQLGEGWKAASTIPDLEWIPTGSPSTWPWPDELETHNETQIITEAEEMRQTFAKPEFHQRQTPCLKQLGKDLSEKAADKRFPALIGRKNELELAVQTLGRLNKNCPIFIGKTELGKRDLVNALAQLTVTGAVEALRNKRIIELDIDKLLNDDPARHLSQIIEEIKRYPIVLFINKIEYLHAIRTSMGGPGPASQLFYAIEHDGVQVIGATSPAGFKNFMHWDPSLSQLFNPIELGPCTVDETVTMLKAHIAQYENKHGVNYSEQSLSGAARMASQYSDIGLPDSAFDLIDEAGSLVKLRNTGEHDNPVEVSEDDVVTAIEKRTKKRVKRLSKSDKAKLKTLHHSLQNVVIGQEGIIKAICKRIRLDASGMREESRPILSALVPGPTGVGKTHIAESLAKLLDIPFLRYDMSEYQEPHSIARMIGSPPGYVGSDNEGRLIQDILDNPECVLLLDEIEKADQSIYKLLLQILEKASLTSSSTGKPACFKKVILIMTSNAAADFMQDMAKAAKGSNYGFEACLYQNKTVTPAETSQDNTEEDDDQDWLAQEKEQKEKDKLIERLTGRPFAPEFLNRIDIVMAAQPLTNEQLRAIVDLLASKLVERVKATNGISLSLSKELKDFITEKGKDPKFGARPLRRALETMVEVRLGDLILDEAVQENDHAIADLQGGKIVITVQSGRQTDSANAPQNTVEIGTEPPNANDTVNAA
jgi:ATP-dependent Clp protease ATP-binding subunit ClpA